jgi:hypothetical protein
MLQICAIGAASKFNRSGQSALATAPTGAETCSAAALMVTAAARVPDIGTVRTRRAAACRIGTRAFSGQARNA